MDVKDKEGKRERLKWEILKVKEERKENKVNFKVKG
jgi:hypothetical protein